MPAAEWILLGAGALGLLGAVLVIAGLVALARARPVRFLVRTLAGLLLASLGALAATATLGLQGYRALTREVVAAQIAVKPAGKQRFAATVRYPDGRTVSFYLAGDEIYADARILKWKPWANMLGVHTAYELDRIAGRYRDIEQERKQPRTVHSLAVDKPVDLFGLRQRHAFLEPVLDAQYGSASYVPVSGPAELELRVSTTGLLIRDVSKPKP